MSLSLSQLRAHVESALATEPRDAVLAYACPQPWTGGKQIQLGNVSLPLRYCESTLAVREALSSDHDGPMVLLVAPPENELGQDILARLLRNRLLHVDNWQLVRQAWGVNQIDPRLYGWEWIAPLLLDSSNKRPDGTALVLTRSDALATCLAHEFGLPADAAEPDSLAHACMRHADRWLMIASERRKVYIQHLEERAGPLATAFVAAMEHGSANAIVAIGLACEVLYHEAADSVPALRDARIRLENRLGGYRLSVPEGRNWAAMAVQMLGSMDERSRLEQDRLATDLLRDTGADAHLSFSTVLLAGLDARLAQLGKAIEKFLRQPATLEQVEAATGAVSAHAMVPHDHPGPGTARMAARLCRSLLASEAGADGTVQGYLRHGAWQEWARHALRGVRPEPFARAAAALLERVAAQRQAADREFAISLQQALTNGASPIDALPIEQALSEIVAPLAQEAPLVVVLMDGMSVDVALALSTGLQARGWTNWKPRTAAPALLATVPSVTECSRTSFFSGRLARGTASDEKKAFSSHADLRQAGSKQKPPELFHKATVAQEHQLNPTLSAAIADTTQRVLGVVINAVDDTLGKSDQIRITWDLETIPLLAELLQEARAAGRAVVLTSDHGHVLERNSTLLEGGPGQRWREANPPAREGELLASGPRVQALMQQDIVVPWREDLRYATRQNGYHGGISRQEMIVPYHVFTPPGLVLPDDSWALFDTPPPSWWRTGAGQQAPLKTGASLHDTSTPVATATPDLFSAPAAARSLVDELASSPVLQAQEERMGRIALERNRLLALVRVLNANGGRAHLEQLAQAVDMPTMRMSGMIAVLARTLNLDGFQVVTFERATGTVLLDQPMLCKQFSL